MIHPPRTLLLLARVRRLSGRRFGHRNTGRTALLAPVFVEADFREQGFHVPDIFTEVVARVRRPFFRQAPDLFDDLRAAVVVGHPPLMEFW
jgi:hypothetical protein